MAMSIEAWARIDDELKVAKADAIDKAQSASPDSRWYTKRCWAFIDAYCMGVDRELGAL